MQNKNVATPEMELILTDSVGNKRNQAALFPHYYVRRTLPLRLIVTLVTNGLSPEMYRITIKSQVPASFNIIMRK